MIKLICSDCDGVLSHVDRDFSEISMYHGEPEIEEAVFVSNYLLKAWMTGEITSSEMNQLMAARFGKKADALDQLLNRNIARYDWNWELLNFYKSCREQGLKVLMTTNNMDVYRETFASFSPYFDGIYNSADLGVLKQDQDFALYRKLAKKYDLPHSEILVVDDQLEILTGLKRLGFQTYCYNSQSASNFKKFVNQGEASRKLSIKIDRPIGYKDDYGNVYPLNYGFVPGLIAGDGEEQDVYVLSNLPENQQPLENFTGKLIGIVHRHNDVEDKWLATTDSETFTAAEISDKVNFLEQYFDSDIEIFEEKK